MSDEKTQLMQSLNQKLAVRDTEGRTVLQMALLATVYVESPWRPEVREAVVSCCEAYARRWGGTLRWAMNPDTEKMEPYSEGKGTNLRSWLPALGEDQHFVVEWHSAEYEWGAGSFSVSALGKQRRSFPVLGYFGVSFPLLWFTQAPGSLPEVLLELCRAFKPASGYGGIGVIDSPDGFTTADTAPIVYQWAQRMPGLEVNERVSHALWLRNGRDGKMGILGASWLTVLGDAFVAELGGTEKLERDLAALDSRFVVHRYEGGLMIQAGPRPELGDTRRDLWPELYVKLAKYLKPIRVTSHNAFQIGGESEEYFDKARSEAWLRRFDDR